MRVIQGRHTLRESDAEVFRAAVSKAYGGDGHWAAAVSIALFGDVVTDRRGRERIFAGCELGVVVHGG